MFSTVIIDSRYKDTAPLEEQIRDISTLALVPYMKSDSYPDFVYDADALVIANTPPIDAELINRLKSCRVICRGGVGYENIDTDAAAKRGIFVTNAPSYCADEVSDHALSLMLAIERRLFISDREMRERKKDCLESIRNIRGLKGRTLGIVGLGNIGRLTAKKAAVFGMDIAYYHPTRHEDVPGDGFIAKWADIGTLFKESDYIIILATSKKENYHMIDERLLSLMKPSAAIINVARGELIDTSALVKALSARSISFAALDVLEGPEYSEINKPLFDLDNVILTPHSAWLSENSERMLLTILGQNIRDALLGLVPRNSIIGLGGI